MAVVLIAVAEQSLRDLLSDVLTRQGFETSVAADGGAALDAVRSAPPDAVVLDLVLPVLDGWGFAEACHRDPACSGVPLILLAPPAYVERAEGRLRSLGVRAVLPKPVALPRLVEALWAEVENGHGAGNGNGRRTP